VDNKALWKRAFTTDPRAVKPITGKQYNGNSPKPYWIVERLTDELGPCGIGWGFTILNERFERFSDTDTLHVAVVRFWYVLDEKRGEFEQIGQTKASYITNAGKFMLDEDAPKKSVTDALVKCASYLGFAGDIFSGRWDDSKYVAEAGREWRERTEGHATAASPIKQGAGTISATAEAYKSLSPDWQAWIDEWAKDVENTFEQQGQAAAQALIDSTMEKEQLDGTHYAALYSKLGSKTRSALKAKDKAEAWKAGMPADKVAA